MSTESLLFLSTTTPGSSSGPTSSGSSLDGSGPSVVRGIEGLLGVVPAMLGYQSSGQVVVIALTDDVPAGGGGFSSGVAGLCALTLGPALAAPPSRGPGEAGVMEAAVQAGADECEVIAAAVLDWLQVVRPSGVVVVGYDPAPADALGPDEVVLAALDPAPAAEGRALGLSAPAVLAVVLTLEGARGSWAAPCAPGGAIDGWSGSVDAWWVTAENPGAGVPALVRSLESVRFPPLPRAGIALPAPATALPGVEGAPVLARSRAEVVARLAPGPGAERVGAEMDALAAGIALDSAEANEAAFRAVFAAWSAVLDPTTALEDVPGATVALAVWAMTDPRIVLARDAVMGALVPGACPLQLLPAPIRALLDEGLLALPWSRPCCTPDLDPGLGSALRPTRTPTGSLGHHPAVVAATTERLEALCALAPNRWAPGVLCLLALHAGHHDLGALASIALQQAGDADPEHHLTHLLEALLARNIHH